jgi:diguanylate cyclase
MVFHFYHNNKTYFTSHALPSKIILGVIAGLSGIILMINSYHVSTTLIVDFRNFSLAIAAIVGGPIAVIIAGFCIVLYRILTTGVTAVTFVLIASVTMQAFTYSIIIHYIKKLKTAWIALYLINMVISSGALFYLLHHEEYLHILYYNYFGGSTILALLIYYLLKYFRSFDTKINKLTEDSTTDFLTSLNNVRGFDQEFNRAMSWSSRKNERLSFLMIDIDFFKKINDTYGHSAGDEILKQIAELLHSTCRSFDIISRNGGEEFSVILQDTPLTHAEEVAERIRVAVEEFDFHIVNQIVHITISIGCSSYPENTSDPDELMSLADKALYQAKQTGRNKVVVFHQL